MRKLYGVTFHDPHPVWGGDTEVMPQWRTRKEAVWYAEREVKAAAECFTDREPITYTITTG